MRVNPWSRTFTHTHITAPASAIVCSLVHAAVASSSSAPSPSPLLSSSSTPVSLSGQQQRQQQQQRPTQPAIAQRVVSQFQSAELVARPSALPAPSSSPVRCAVASSARSANALGFELLLRTRAQRVRQQYGRSAEARQHSEGTFCWCGTGVRLSAHA